MNAVAPALGTGPYQLAQARDWQFVMSRHAPESTRYPGPLRMGQIRGPLPTEGSEEAPSVAYGEWTTWHAAALLTPPGAMAVDQPASPDVLTLQRPCSEELPDPGVIDVEHRGRLLH